MKNKISLAIFLLLMHLCSWAQIGGDYNPTNPSDPGNPTQEYTLTLKATPTNGGSFNTTSTNIAGGKTYNLRAYPNTDFAFVAWLCDGDTLSKSASYNYTMPSHNVDITGVFTYRPSSPSDPQEQALKYQLSLTAVPMNSGSFNISNERLAAGSSNSLRAYANTDFVFKCWMIGDSILSINANMDFVMPAHNVQMVGVFEYNPASPANPNRNHWNATLGEVIVDDFTPGNLSSAISTVISGSSSNDVQMIIVSGRMNSNDFGIANNYSNCTLLDLSRVTGVTEVPSYAFDYTNLETVYLSATIEKIGARAFAECTKLSSLTIYAMTPPTLESQVFQGVPEGLVVYVPAAAIAQYQDIEAWSKFTLLPIQEDIRSVSVSLPEGANASDYAQMWLELTNTKSGQRMHYVMTDRTQYTFANIIRNTSWNVTLRNERGDVFGKIDDVEVKDEDVTVAFATLSKPQTVSLVVKTPDGQDVTAQTQITWTDAQGGYVAQGASLAGLPAGYKANYRVVLSQELAMQYDAPQAEEHVLTDGGNDIVCQLQPIKQIQISGKVKDAATGLPISGAVISASQTFGGKYSKTLNAKTDGNGVFTLDIANVPTSVAFAASDYISQTVNCDSLLTEAGEVTLPDVMLKAITGATISLGFTYTTCDGETQNRYSDYQNINYELFNVTKNKTVSQYNVQYPQIVLLEDVEDGDVLRLTATSRTNAFMPVEATDTIAEQKAEAMLGIVELGQIRAGFTTTGNASVVGSLYDGAGKLQKTYDYTNASLTISDLADGLYTLVSMGSSRLFNTIYDLSQLPQTGLVEGSDYVQHSVEVKSGTISLISINEVPTLDESKLYYTGEGTSFTVNKPSIVAGNYLTLTGRLDFKPAYATSVSNVQMIVDLPESCEFVENSVMVGNSTSSYTLNGNRISIPMPRYTDRVRFCIIPTLGGEYAPSAFAQFDLNGETVTQPIGSANYTVKDLSISVPSTVAKTTIPVSGTAIGTSNVEIYDNDVLIGQTTSMANGTWTTTCELNEPYNLSTHSIYAKVTTKQGIVLQSETKDLTYDMNAIQIQKVTMYHYNPEMHTTFESVFDFQNPHTTPNQWTVYYPNKKFTYTVDFTNNSPDKVSNIILYIHAADGQIVPLYPAYDEKKDIWVADLDMGNRSDGYYPVNVSIDYSVISDVQFDADIFRNSYEALNISKQEISYIIDELLDLSNQVSNVLEKDEIDSVLLSNLLSKSRNAAGLFDDLVEIPNFSDMNEEDVASYIESLLISTEEITDEKMTSFVESYFSQSFDEALQTLDGISVSQNLATIEELQEMGYVEFNLTDSTSVFILATETEYVIIDFANNRKIAIDLSMVVPAESRRTHPSLMLAPGDFISTMQGYLESTKDYWDKLRDYFSRVAGLVEDVLDILDKKNAQLAENVHQLDAAIEWIEQQPYKDKPYWKDLLKKYNKQRDKALKDAVSNNNITHWIEKNISPNRLRVGKIGGGVFAAIDASLVIVSACDDISNVISLYQSIPNPCEDDEARADNLRGKVQNTGIAAGVYYTAQFASDIVQIVSLCTSVPALIPSGGTSLALVAASVGLAVANFAACYAYEKIFKNRMNDHYNEALTLKCLRNCGEEGMPPCPPPPPGGGSGGPGGGSGGSGNGGGTGSGSSNDGVKIDPSGYVYEGIASNRLEGVTATIYYKEDVEDMYGDLHENIVKWDAEEYAQENPLFTDENGMYAWDVPQGLWQVKFEKEGYETAYSEWLPVPPPQLDVNIAMKQNRQPEVKAARAYEDAVEMEFDKYMMSELLTAENISVMQNGTAVEGTIELLNAETTSEGSNESFASKVRVNAAEPFTEQEVTLKVSNRVKSYAGIRMQDDYQQTFSIEQEIKQIVCDSVVTVGYGSASTLTIAALPASASKGKTLTVKTSSSMILGVETEQVTIGNDGKVEIIVTGELPGTAALTFAVEGTDKTAMTIANVEQEVIKTVATPKASIASGTVVEKGTAITLTCETEDATIYYTLDGSCPCDNSDARKAYDGTPIIINENMTIKAMAVAPDMYDSEVAEFTYIVEGTGIYNVTDNGQIQIYPLPVRDKVNISADGKSIKSVTISSLNGVVVASANKPATAVTLDVSRIPTGIYIINVATVDSTFSRKILKVE